jgi:hypothetical protein
MIFSLVISVTISPAPNIVKDVVVVFREAFSSCPSIRLVIHPWMTSYREENTLEVSEILFENPSPAPPPPPT